MIMMICSVDGRDVQFSCPVFHLYKCNATMFYRCFQDTMNLIIYICNPGQESALSVHK